MDSTTEDINLLCFGNENYSSVDHFTPDNEELFNFIDTVKEQSKIQDIILYPRNHPIVSNKEDTCTNNDWDFLNDLTCTAQDCEDDSISCNEASTVCSSFSEFKPYTDVFEDCGSDFPTFITLLKALISRMHSVHISVEDSQIEEHETCEWLSDTQKQLVSQVNSVVESFQDDNKKRTVLLGVKYFRTQERLSEVSNMMLKVHAPAKGSHLRSEAVRHLMQYHSEVRKLHRSIKTLTKTSNKYKVAAEQRCEEQSSKISSLEMRIKELETQVENMQESTLSKELVCERFYIQQLEAKLNERLSSQADCENPTKETKLTEEKIVVKKRQKKTKFHSLETNSKECQVSYKCDSCNTVNNMSPATTVIREFETSIHSEKKLLSLEAFGSVIFYIHTMVEILKLKGLLPKNFQKSLSSSLSTLEKEGFDVKVEKEKVICAVSQLNSIFCEQATQTEDFGYDSSSKTMNYKNKNIKRALSVDVEHNLKKKSFSKKIDAVNERNLENLIRKSPFKNIDTVNQQSKDLKDSISEPISPFSLSFLDEFTFRIEPISPLNASVIEDASCQELSMPDINEVDEKSENLSQHQDGSTNTSVTVNYAETVKDQCIAQRTRSKSIELHVSTVTTQRDPKILEINSPKKNFEVQTIANVRYQGTQTPIPQLASKSVQAMEIKNQYQQTDNIQTYCKSIQTSHKVYNAVQTDSENVSHKSIQTLQEPNVLTETSDVIKNTSTGNEVLQEAYRVQCGTVKHRIIYKDKRVESIVSIKNSNSTLIANHESGIALQAITKQSEIVEDCASIGKTTIDTDENLDISNHLNDLANRRRPKKKDLITELFGVVPDKKRDLSPSSGGPLSKKPCRNVLPIKQLSSTAASPVDVDWLSKKADNCTSIEKVTYKLSNNLKPLLSFSDTCRVPKCTELLASKSIVKIDSSHDVLSAKVPKEIAITKLSNASKSNEPQLPTFCLNNNASKLQLKDRYTILSLQSQYPSENAALKISFTNKKTSNTVLDIGKVNHAASTSDRENDMGTREKIAEETNCGEADLERIFTEMIIPKILEPFPTECSVMQMITEACSPQNKAKSSRKCLSGRTLIQMQSLFFKENVKIEELTPADLEKMLSDVYCHPGKSRVHSVAEALVLYVARCPNRLDTMSLSSPLFAPSPTELRVLTLVDKLECKLLTDLTQVLFATIQDCLLSETPVATIKEVPALCAVTRIMTLLRKRRADIESVLDLVCDALFKLGIRGVPVMYTVLCTWPQILDPRKDSAPNEDLFKRLPVLSQCLVQAVMLLDRKGNDKVSELQDFFVAKYKLKADKKRTSKIIADVFKLLRAGMTDGVEKGVRLLIRLEEFHNKMIKIYGMELAKKASTHDKEKVAQIAVSLLSFILARNFCSISQRLREKFVIIVRKMLLSDSVSETLQESGVRALLQLCHVKYYPQTIDVLRILSKWEPRSPISNVLKHKLRQWCDFYLSLNQLKQFQQEET